MLKLVCLTFVLLSALVVLECLADDIKEPTHVHGQTNIVSSAVRGVGRLVKSVANEVVKLGTNVSKTGYEFGRNTVGAGVQTAREGFFRIGVPRHGVFPSQYKYQGPGNPPTSIGGSQTQQANQGSPAAATPATPATDTATPATQ